MKKIILVLIILLAFGGYAQQSFDQVKSLTNEKKAYLQSKINLVESGNVVGEVNYEDKKIINDLKLFLDNPFDTRISNFSLSVAIEKLEEIAKKIIIQNNSKSNITIQKENALNYNGNFDKLLSLPIRLKSFESGLKKTIINIK